MSCGFRAADLGLPDPGRVERGGPLRRRPRREHDEEEARLRGGLRTDADVALLAGVLGDASAAATSVAEGVSQVNRGLARAGAVIESDGAGTAASHVAVELPPPSTLPKHLLGSLSILEPSASPPSDPSRTPSPSSAGSRPPSRSPSPSAATPAAVNLPNVNATIVHEGRTARLVVKGRTQKKKCVLM